MRLRAILLGCALALVALVGWYVFRPSIQFPPTLGDVAPTLSPTGSPTVAAELAASDLPAGLTPVPTGSPTQILSVATATSAPRMASATPPPPSSTATSAPSATATQATPSATPTKAPASPTRTPTRTPTPKPSPTTTKVVPPQAGTVKFGTPKASPSEIFYGGPGCKPTSATIRETVSSSTGISAVSMRYGPVNTATNAVEHWIPQNMTPAGSGWTGSIATSGVLNGYLSGSLVHVWVYFVSTDSQGVQTNSPTYQSLLDVRSCPVR